MEERFEEVLKRLSFKNPSLKKIYIVSKIRNEVKKWLPEDLAEEVHVVNYIISEKTLLLACSNNFVKQEIVFRENEILKKLNLFFGTDEIKKIKLV
ncbi:MAG TPA: DciA family protein [Defluviitoga sp.]|nr:DciA family protein [Defluviitoga sp.]HOP24296.1 DciA family protein [Defluviitoga sp.]HPZ28112.1 DciA family protein [Defluviitoga sp.]HQD62002.1 DciA family protein [Defluviitoga sp.]